MNNDGREFPKVKCDDCMYGEGEFCIHKSNRDTPTRKDEHRCWMFLTKEFDYGNSSIFEGNFMRNVKIYREKLREMKRRGK